MCISEALSSTRSAFLIVALLLQLVICELSLGQRLESRRTNQVTDQETEIAAKLIHDYFKNRKRLDRFAMSCSVIFTKESFGKPQSSFSQDTCYLQCWDAATNRRRFDEIGFVQSSTIASDGRPVGTRPSSKSIVIIGNELNQFTGQGRIVNFEDPISKDPNEHDLRLVPQVVFDIWDLPFNGRDCFASQYVARLHFFKAEEFFEKQTVKAVQKTLEAVEVEYLLSKEHRYFCQIVFGTKSGGMPIQANLVQRGEDDNARLVASTQTSWKKKEDVWLPTGVVVVSNLGNVRRPSGRKTYECSLEWAIGKQFPDEVFSLDQGSVVDGYSLRNSISQYASVKQRTK